MIRPSIQAMSGYVSGEQPAPGAKVIKLNTNENPYPCSPRVLTAIREAMAGGLQKYPDPLATAFRMRAGDVLGIDPDWIQCGNGSDDILTILIRAFVGAQDGIRYAYPGYILYRTLAQIQEATVDEWKFRSDWTLDDAFATANSRLRLAFLANPNSPSGTVIPANRVFELADALPCPLVVDEAYADFAETNCLRLVAENEKIIVTRTLSKSYALAGLRFGFVIAQPRIIEQLAKIKDSYNCDILSIAGATAAMDDQGWLIENRQAILATRDRLVLRFRDLGFETPPSQANFIWATRTDRPVRPIYEQLKRDGVLVRYLDYAGWGDGLRISVGTDSQIDALLALVEGMVS
ncbi:MAG: histidinol-phosphate transaminase [Pirellulales bacterium]|nr:histidinol-phosphate transaminase [Pirellulales bacterium]